LDKDEPRLNWITVAAEIKAYSYCKPTTSAKLFDADLIWDSGYSTTKLSVKPAQMKPYVFSSAGEGLQGDCICADTDLSPITKSSELRSEVLPLLLIALLDNSN
jgi:hypothetical protein